MGDSNELKPHTKAELDQQAIWADEFDKWWIEEGQYHRAGGNDYCRTFAWWAWLNREQSKQSKINELQNQLKSIVSEFDLWGGASDQVERQIEIIKELIK